MTKSKATNYTAEQVEVLTTGYTGADNATEVKALAEAVGKTPASVRAKLANLGLYQKSEPEKTETGERATKAVKAQAVAELANLNEVEQEALTKTTGAVLDKLLARLTNVAN